MIVEGRISKMQLATVFLSQQNLYSRGFVEKIFANCFPAMKIDWTANQSGDGNYHKTCAQASYQRRQFGSFRPARQGNYRQHNQNNYYSRHTDGFSQQTTAGQSRGFKKNNVKHRNNYHGQGVNTENVYTIPVSNRFQGNC